MAKTAISWADEVWNPVTGCSRVSAGCDHCYAFELHDRRHLQNKSAALELYGPMTDAIDHARRKHHEDLPWPPQYDLPFSSVQLMPARLPQPLGWRRPRRCFVNSMSDLFHEDVPETFLDQVFATMALADRHQFLVLTKRPERMLEYLTPQLRGEPTDRIPHARIARTAEEIAANRGEDVSSPWWDTWLERWPLANVWLGVSVEDQAAADLRIPLLLETPAAVRWISAEPLLGELRLEQWLAPECRECHGSMSVPVAGGGRACPRCFEHQGMDPDRLDWVVVGGESGPHYREMDLAWAAGIRNQCAAAGVAYFGKQRSGPKAGVELPFWIGDRAWPMEPLEHLQGEKFRV